MTNYHQPLMPDCYYHLFSRAVGAEKLFLSNDNYRYFLQKLQFHTTDVCKLYAYTLMPNHFHFLVRIESFDDILNHFTKIKSVAFNPQIHSMADFIMERFSNFLNSYTKAFNKLYNRKGALFMDYLKRSKVETSADFTAFIWYIHKNAVHHKITTSIGEWYYDSYNAILSEAPTLLMRNEVLNWFGNRTEFVKFHQQEIYTKQNASIDFFDF